MKTIVRKWLRTSEDSNRAYCSYRPFSEWCPYKMGSAKLKWPCSTCIFWGKYSFHCYLLLSSTSIKEQQQNTCKESCTNFHTSEWYQKLPFSIWRRSESCCNWLYDSYWQYNNANDRMSTSILWASLTKYTLPWERLDMN